MIQRQPYLPRFMAAAPAIRSAPCFYLSNTAFASTDQCAGDDRQTRFQRMHPMVNDDVIDLTAESRSAPRSSYCGPAARTSVVEGRQ